MADKQGAIPKPQKNNKKENPSNEEGAIGPIVENNPNGEIPINNPETLSDDEQTSKNVTRHIKQLTPRDLITLIDLRGLSSNDTLDELADRMVRVAVWRKEASVDEIDPSASLSHMELRESVVGSQSNLRVPTRDATFVSSANSLQWESYGAPRIERTNERRSITWEDNLNDQRPNREFISPAASSTSESVFNSNQERVSETVSKQQQQLVKKGIKYAGTQDDAGKFLRELNEASIKMPAKAWYREKRASIVDYADFVKRFRLHFSTPDYSNQVWTELQNRTQGANEDFTSPVKLAPPN
ncbi:hypothetical protein PV327_011439, partial [Microctonus hyperodae]